MTGKIAKNSFYSEVLFVFGPGIDVDDWETLYDQDRIPGAWPYGLERIRDWIPTIAVPPVPLPKGLVALAKWMIAGPPRKPDATKLALAWEENTALSLFGIDGIRGAGCIWLTDLPTGWKRRVMRPVSWLVLSQLDFVWCLSRHQADIVSRRLARSRVMVAPILFGIDELFFGLWPHTASNHVFSAGTDRDRDVHGLLRAFEIVKQHNSQFTAEIQFDGELAVPSYVTHHRRLSHASMRQKYRDAAVVAVALRDNHHVSGMTVALEAMATGRPVVISNTAGMGEYVTHEKTGLVVPVGDPDAMAGEILRLLADDEYAEDMGKMGRADVELRFTSSQMADCIVRLATTAVANQK